MNNNLEHQKSIHKVLLNIIKKNQNKDMNVQVNFVKTLLCYVAKVCLIAIEIDSDNFSYNDIDSRISLDVSYKFPEVFYILPEKYIDHSQIPFDDRDLIIKNILKISKDEISQISLGELFQAFITNKEKKYFGQVYTPKYIVKQMIDDTIKKEDIVANPYFKIIDPACGGGYFLLEAYDKLKGIFKNNYVEIVLKNPDLKQEIDNGLHSFIIKNNLWGTDIDEFAVFMTTISLLIKGDRLTNLSLNVFKKDILLDGRNTLFSLIDNNDNVSDLVLDEGFDLVIGNPPYIGHKKIEINYRRKLQNYYSDVYSDKSDISFCFFKKGYELLKKQGTLMFITSRYFLESPSAKGLRSFLTSNFDVKTIIDFQGKKVFKGIGISPVIIKCRKGQSLKNITNIYKLKSTDGLDKKNSPFVIKEIFKNFIINQSIFSPKGWLLMDEKERAVYEKIHTMGDYYLNQVSNCHQGVITGCDTAFIVDEKTILDKNLNKYLIKPWVKNSQVQKFKVLDSRLYIIYTDLINNISSYPNVINHIAPYKERLKNRRECLKGMREWYQLQWGRRLELFSNPKIMFPFKAENNRFAIVYDEMLCSADVYIINIEHPFSPVSLEYLAAFLNSSVFEFYFKSVGKKVGENQYDYYPNKIMNLRIKIGNNTKNIENEVQELARLYKQLDIKNKEDKYNISIMEKYILQKTSYINDYFYNLYELSDNEVKIVENNIDNSVS